MTSSYYHQCLKCNIYVELSITTCCFCAAHLSCGLSSAWHHHWAKHFNQVYCAARLQTLSLFALDVLVTLTNTMRPRQDGQHFSDDFFKCFFFNYMTFVVYFTEFCSKRLDKNIPAMAQIMAWRRRGDIGEASNEVFA